MTYDQTFPGPSGLSVKHRVWRDLLPPILHSCVLSWCIHYIVNTRLCHPRKKNSFARLTWMQHFVKEHWQALLPWNAKQYLTTCFLWPWEWILKELLVHPFGESSQRVYQIWLTPSSIILIGAILNFMMICLTLLITHLAYWSTSLSTKQKNSPFHFLPMIWAKLISI